MIEREIEVDILEAARLGEGGDPVQPIRLQAGDSFCFSCRRENACWNKCCHGADITLTPYDILRLSRHFDIRPAEFLVDYTVPAVWEKANLPVAKLRMTGEDGTGPCPFLTPEGCTVYENRPATCRYYPLGLASVKMKGAEEKDEFYFLVREPHCEGHEIKGAEQTCADYIAGQGLTDYEAVNQGWIDILMKMASWKMVGGPFGQDLTPQTQKMFFMVSTDVDALRRFVFESRFLETYEIEEETIEVLKESDEALLALGFDWMKNVLFNDPTINMKDTVLQAAIVKARRDMGVG